MDQRRQILKLPTRNANFTGREHDLRRLREELRAGGGAVGRPVILQGLAGVGKTQVAVEYAHRFMADYDVIWWMNCGQAQYIDASLADLGKRMREVFGAGLPEEGSVAEVASQVLQLLSDTRTEQRWLLVYDNADEIEAVQPLLPTGHGHVLITSPIRAWSDQGQSLPVEVFTRDESILHLQQRLPKITNEAADQVADALGDLPLAVAAAGAWLAETGMAVPEYLEQLSSQPASSVSFAQLADYPLPVAKAWDLSLDRLQETAPAAARLFDLCSVMAPDISLELIYSKAMAAVLAPLDSDFSEPMIIGTVIRRLDRLALIKLDTSAHQIVVHRLLQAVVRERMSAEEMAAAQRDVHRVLVAARPDSEVDDPAAWSALPADLAAPDALGSHVVAGGAGPPAAHRPRSLPPAARRPRTRPPPRPGDRGHVGADAVHRVRPGDDRLAAQAAVPAALQPGEHHPRPGRVHPVPGTGRGGAERSAGHAG